MDRWPFDPASSGVSTKQQRKGIFVANPEIYAVIDLGSNSFRLELSQPEGGKLRRLAYHKETVRLGAGLDAQKNLSPEAMRKGWACLHRFAAVMLEHDPQHIVAIATQTLREAQNAAEFQRRAETILACPLRIISGREEAGLIYQGVCSRLPAGKERRLVIDIGGRSTEIILGQGSTAEVAESFPIGSVGLSQNCFAAGRWNASSFAQGVAAAKAVLAPASSLYPRADWTVAYGSAGTTSAVAEVLQAAGKTKGGAVSPAGLDWLKTQVLAAGCADDLVLPGLKEERKPVLAGGLAVLLALFEVLQIEDMRIVSGALRQGLLQSLLQAPPAAL